MRELKAGDKIRVTGTREQLRHQFTHPEIEPGDILTVSEQDAPRGHVRVSEYDYRYFIERECVELYEAPKKLHDIKTIYKSYNTLKEQVVRTLLRAVSRMRLVSIPVDIYTSNNKPTLVNVGNYVRVKYDFFIDLCNELNVSWEINKIYAGIENKETLAKSMERLAELATAELGVVSK